MTRGGTSLRPRGKVKQTGVSATNARRLPGSPVGFLHGVVIKRFRIEQHPSRNYRTNPVQ
jgi:hypothetical protein